MGRLGRMLEGLGLSKKRVEVLSVGLDNSGKSTILEFYKEAPAEEIVPTVGFKVEKFKRSGIAFTVFDMSGQGRYRDFWPHYYETCAAVMFAIDASDRARLCVARDELARLLEHPEFAARPEVPILFLLNKRDVEGAMGQEEVGSALGLDGLLGERAWHLQACIAFNGEGLDDGLKWLTTKLSERR